MHRRAAAPTRRAVLAGAAAVLVAPALNACTDAGEDDPPEVDADVVAADRAALRERRLLAAYDAALVIAPQLTERLLPLRADHEAHLAAAGVPETPGPTASSSAASTPTPVAAPSLPADPGALLAALADLERRAATAHGSAAVLGGRGVGAVLAALSASEASHVEALA